MNKLVIGNLVHRPLRSLISVFAVAIEVIMILSIAAIMLGIINGVAKGQSGIGADMLTHPGAASNLIGVSVVLPLPLKSPASSPPCHMCGWSRPSISK